MINFSFVPPSNVLSIDDEAPLILDPDKTITYWQKIYFHFFIQSPHLLIFGIFPLGWYRDHLIKTFSLSLSHSFSFILSLSPSLSLSLFLSFSLSFFLSFILSLWCQEWDLQKTQNCLFNLGLISPKYNFWSLGEDLNFRALPVVWDRLSDSPLLAFSLLGASDISPRAAVAAKW